MKPKSRNLVAGIAGHLNDPHQLGLLKELVEHCDKEEVLREIEYRLEYIKLCNAPGDKNCRFCHGYGSGVDGRGDPWVCTDCKPYLKNFWKDK